MLWMTDDAMMCVSSDDVLRARVLEGSRDGFVQSNKSTAQLTTFFFFLLLHFSF